MRYLLIFGVLFLAACKEPRECLSPEFSKGDTAVFKKSGESVRVVGLWRIAFDSCKFNGEYDIRFNDGAEITVNHYELTQERD